MSRRNETQQGGDVELSDGLLRQLLRTKLAVVAVSGTLMTVLVLIVDHVLRDRFNWGWYEAVPISRIAEDFLAIFVLLVIFEYFVRDEAEQVLVQRLGRLLPTQANALRAAIVEGYSLDPEFVATVDPEVIDSAIRNALSVRIRDESLATDVYDDLLQQIFRAPARWFDLHVSTSISPWTEGPGSGTGSMFVATVRWAYKTMIERATLQFAAVDDEQLAERLMDDADYDVAWYIESLTSFPIPWSERFGVIRASIDGKDLKVRTRQSAGRLDATISGAELTAAVGRSARVAYTYRILVQQDSHTLKFDVAQPTRGAQFEFIYTGSGIRHVNVLDFFGSPARPRVERTKRGEAVARVTIALDGWVMPHSGVGFVWVLEREISHDRTPDADPAVSEADPAPRPNADRPRACDRPEN